jgi:hypothetical protein
VIACALACTGQARVIISATSSAKTATTIPDVRAACDSLLPQFNCTKVWSFGAQGDFAADVSDAQMAKRLRALEADIDAFVLSAPAYEKRLGNVTWRASQDIPISGKGGETRLPHVTSQSDFSDFRVERPLTVLATPEGTSFTLSDPALLKVQDNAPRHLRQISGIQFGDPDETFKFHRFSSGVHVYVVDGILNEGHDEFKNMFSGQTRVSSVNHRSQIAQEMFDKDPDCATAHGTHVASLAAGYGYGVAKNATLVSVGVQPGCEESGFSSDLLEGLAWVHTHYLSLPEPRPPALVTMSLLVSVSPAADEIERVIDELIDTGIIVVAAAGNFADDACLYVPARMPRVVTVAAVDESFAGAWSWSNTGECVDIWSPGENILGAGSECVKCTSVFSGTSQATPIVTGLIAHLLETSPEAGVDEVRAMLSETAEALVGLPTGGIDRVIQFKDEA